MKRQLLFIQDGSGTDDQEADAKLVSSLQKTLGSDYSIHYPLLLEEPAPDFGRTKQIDNEVSLIGGQIILVGHSLGASMLLKYLSENDIEPQITGIFLISTPFWSGDEEWKTELKLQENFAEKLPEIPIFLYHCQDDEEVPFEHLFRYAEQMPHATIREVTTGGHQFNNNLTIVAEDIKSLRR